MTCENHFSNEDLGAAPIPSRGRAVLMNVKGQKRKEKKKYQFGFTCRKQSRLKELMATQIYAKFKQNADKIIFS